MLLFDKIRLVYRQRVVEDFAELLCENDGNGASVARVDGNGKCTGIAIIAIDRSIGFPDAISVAGWVIVVANEKNFRPKIFIQTVLRFDRGQIITSGDNAAIEHDEIVFAWREKDWLLRARAKSEARKQECAMIGDLGKQARVHKRWNESRCIYNNYSTYNTRGRLGNPIFHEEIGGEGS